ncbi:MAG: TldD/PmbA family protein [Dehalococcoidia bacterium]|nr:TldD/PmbA family protein [Dehalococcoidia bacterium]
MKDLTQRALDSAAFHGAKYADIRIVQKQNQSITVKNGKVKALNENESLGFGIRVLVDGAWGFASSFLVEAKEIDRVARVAVGIARASASLRLRNVELGSPVVQVATYRTPIQIDPFAVSLEEKIALLLTADASMRGAKNIVVAESGIECLRENTVFASSEGSYIEQEFIETGCGIEAMAADGSEVQRRSYPNSVGRHMGREGYEFVGRQDLPGNARRIGEEASALLTAKQCPSGVTTVILDGTQVALQIHESCGHPAELDRALGDEAAFAGTSFLTPDKLDKLRYGSQMVNISADATVPGGLGTFGFDDEGVPAQRIPIVKDGIFVGYLMSRETAAILGLASNGTMRADGWNRIPLIRMTNVNIEPGQWTLADLISDTEEGIFMQTNSSWSIDDKRLNFQFGTEIAWQIKNGQMRDMLKNATYTGITPEFWGNCDAICNRDHWTVWGTPNCGKGQPVQVAHVSHGAAPARFRQVRVGLMK